MSLPFQEDDLVLFTGDSITDCGRDRSDPASLGMGYVHLLAERLGRESAGLRLRFRNTGISGNCCCSTSTSRSPGCV